MTSRSAACTVLADHLCLLPHPPTFVDTFADKGLFLRKGYLAMPYGMNLFLQTSLLKLGSTDRIGVGSAVGAACDDCGEGLMTDLLSNKQVTVCSRCDKRAPRWDGLVPSTMLRSTEEIITPNDVRAALTPWFDRFVPGDPLALVLAVDEFATYLLDAAEEQERIAQERGLAHVAR